MSTVRDTGPSSSPILLQLPFEQPSWLLGFMSGTDHDRGLNTKPPKPQPTLPYLRLPSATVGTKDGCVPTPNTPTRFHQSTIRGSLRRLKITLNLPMRLIDRISANFDHTFSFWNRSYSLPVNSILIRTRFFVQGSFLTLERFKRMLASLWILGRENLCISIA